MENIMQNKRQFISMVMAHAAVLAGPVGLWLPAQAFNLSQADAASGLRAALERGATQAVSMLGKPDGFLGNDTLRIPLPGFLNDLAPVLKATGQKQRLDDLVVAMNRAAEAAVPQAKSLLISAVKGMSVTDARQVIAGGNDSVTQFFAQKTREPLQGRFLPIVQKSTAKVDLASKYNGLVEKASRTGLVKKESANIEQHVTNKALDGLYWMIGEEERKIRQDPVATGSAILKKVFGGLR
jgi:hypothetical protein